MQWTRKWESRGVRPIPWNPGIRDREGYHFLVLSQSVGSGSRFFLEGEKAGKMEDQPEVSVFKATYDFLRRKQREDEMVVEFLMALTTLAR